MDKIQELKKKHYNIKEVIKNHIRRKTDYSKHVQEYLKIVQELREAGIEVNDTSSYIQQALNGTVNITSEANNIIKYPDVKPAIVIEEPEKSIYKITVAWTERPGREPNNTLTIIENYLKENNAHVIDNTEADFDEYKEIMRVYEWEGDDKEFNILRKSANFILDVFAANQYEKFNISIFGSKKK